MKNALRSFLIVASATAVLAAPAFAGVSVTHSAPEPATLLLLAGGVGAVAVLRRFRAKA